MSTLSPSGYQIVINRLEHSERTEPKPRKGLMALFPVRTKIVNTTERVFSLKEAREGVDAYTFRKRGTLQYVPSLGSQDLMRLAQFLSEKEGYLVTRVQVDSLHREGFVASEEDTEAFTQVFHDEGVTDPAGEIHRMIDDQIHPKWCAVASKIDFIDPQGHAVSIARYGRIGTEDIEVAERFKAGFVRAWHELQLH